MKRTIPIAKPVLGKKELEAVKEVFESGMLIQGKKVKLFEERFAEYIGVEHAIAVTNGTVALDVALKALNLGPGDEVITPAFSFIASSNCILFQNAKPVFADIDPRTFNIDPSDVAEKITAKTKALIPVHLFGHKAPDSYLAPSRKTTGEIEWKEEDTQVKGSKPPNDSTFALDSQYDDLKAGSALLLVQPGKPTSQGRARLATVRAARAVPNERGPFKDTVTEVTLDMKVIGSDLMEKYSNNHTTPMDNAERKATERLPQAGRYLYL